MPIRMIDTNKAEVINLCTVCDHFSSVVVDLKGYYRWSRGEPIQNALPELSPEEREILITGAHPECWDKMFGGEEED